MLMGSLPGRTGLQKEWAAPLWWQLDACGQNRGFLASSAQRQYQQLSTRGTEVRQLRFRGWLPVNHWPERSQRLILSEHLVAWRMLMSPEMKDRSLTSSPRDVFFWDTGRPSRHPSCMMWNRECVPQLRCHLWRVQVWHTGGKGTCH